MNKEIIGNLTTILKFACMTLAGYLIGVAASHGLNLPIDQQQLSEIFVTIIFFAFAYLDAKYPNTFSFLGNSKVALAYETEEKILNDEYVTNEEE